MGWEVGIILLNRLVGKELCQTAHNPVIHGYTIFYNCQKIIVMVAEYFQDVVHVQVCTLSARS